ncbi:MAG TPA: hypothetical protein VFO60_12065 [Candidatus Dormibacteraeota bacterium]|nr:hypothetical protein [Candidatus Dormibacteraeota bacterium]
MDEAPRRRVLRTAAEVPVALVEEIADDMAVRLSGTVEARSCAGLSFSYVVSDRRVPRYRYAVGEGGGVTLTRRDSAPSTFVFTATVGTFDDVLRGRASALVCLLTGRVHLTGSFLRIRSLLRLMPAVERAYVAARRSVIDRHADRYDVRF